MPMFSNAQNVVINNGQFTDVTMPGPSGIDILLEQSIPDAAYNSSARHPPPTCFPGTREQYVEDIVNWATPTEGQNPPWIYWMRGPGGVGKSAVAQTCTEQVQVLGRLGAAFFFSINGRDDHTRFFTSLAYQLSTEFSDYRDIIDRKIYHNKLLVSSTLASQFEALIAGPLQELGRNGKGVGRRAVFIDGLDECNDQDAQCEIIEIIAESVRDHTTPFCWAFFSRSEPHIEATFATVDIAPFCQRSLLSISRDTDSEIDLYLRDGFRAVLRRYNLPLQASWPSDKEIQILVDGAAGLFIFAVTVLRFIRHAIISGGEPKEALSTIIQSISSRPRVLLAKDGQRHPFAEMDSFYLLIMQRIPDEMLTFVQLVLLCMIRNKKFSEPQGWYSILLANILGFSEIRFRNICHRLHAVLHVEEPQTGPSIPRSAGGLGDGYSGSPHVSKSQSPIPREATQLGGKLSFYHRSFVDFLVDPARSGRFFIEAQTIRENLLKYCLQRVLGYDHYSVQNSGLSAPDGQADTVLSWSSPQPGANAILNLAIHGTAWNIMNSLVIPSDVGKLDREVLRELASINHRLHLQVRGCVIKDGNTQGRPYIPAGRVKNVGGTLLFRITPEEFQDWDASGFIKELANLEASKMIRSHLPQDMLFIRQWLVRRRFRGRPHLYILGHGVRKVFWYWELNLESRSFRAFHAFNVVEGMEIYRKEQTSFFKVT